MAVENFIAVSKTDSPQASMVKWDGVNLTQLDTFVLSSYGHVCAWHPNANIVAFGNNGIHVLGWDGANFSEVDTLVLGTTVYGLAFSPNGQWLAIASANSPYFRIAKWDGSSLSVVDTFTFPNSCVDCSWTPDSQFIAVAYHRKTPPPDDPIPFKVLRWNGASLTLADSLHIYNTYEGEQYGVHLFRSCHFCADGKYIVVAYSNGGYHCSVLSWNGSKLGLVDTYTIEWPGYINCRFNPQGDLIGLCRPPVSPYFTLLKFDGSNLTVGGSMDLGTGPMQSTFDPTGKLLFVAHYGVPFLTLLEWNGSSLSEKATCNVGSNGTCCAFYVAPIPIPPGPPTDLLCEQKKNPTDVTDPKPEFSAIFHGD